MKELIDASEALAKSNAFKAAYQLMYPAQAARQGTMVDAPIGDNSQVHVFTTRNVISTTSRVNATASGESFALLAGPGVSNFVARGWTYDSTGKPLTWVQEAPQGSSGWATNFTDLRCCAIQVTAHNTTQADLRRGQWVAGNINPRTPGGAATGYTFADLADEKTAIVSAAGNGEMVTMNWFPVEPDIDHGWFGPTDAAPAETTALFLSWEGAAASGAVADTGGENTFYIEVTAIWSGKVEQEIENLLPTAIYPMDPKDMGAMTVAMNVKAPMYTMGRHISKDDGFSFFANLARSVWDTGKQLVGSVKQLVSRDASIMDRFNAARSAVESGALLYGTVAPLFSVEERVTARLLSLRKSELATAARILAAAGVRPDISPEESDRAYARLQVLYGGARNKRMKHTVKQLDDHKIADDWADLSAR
jgi:hypothetical protein